MTGGQPRIFIGTMFCGEGDFQRSLKAITQQDDVIIVEHKIISNQPEKEAHDSLWAAFRQAAQEGCDMLTKIDADTVLAHPHVLRDIYALFEANPRVTGVQAPLYDYFTDGFINGLNNFSPKVQFKTSPELYCDRVDTGHDIVLKAKDMPKSLQPAGLHCCDANPIQAFHYGLHRALKNQLDVRNHVVAAWSLDKTDVTRWFAVEGFRAADGFRDHKGFNYQDEKFQEAFEKAKSKWQTYST